MPYTPRQRQIFEMIAQGKTTREIADALGLKYHTILNQISRGMASVGAANRIQAIHKLQEHPYENPDREQPVSNI